MKKALLLTALTVVLCVWIPWLAVGMPEKSGEATIPAVSREETIPPQEKPLRDEEIRLTVLRKDGSAQVMTLKDYLLGAVLGEMPKDFPLEAQKAQAVVCRTYALRQKESGKHAGADICMDSACCQAWQEPNRYSEESRRPAETAVTATDGAVLRYGGGLIDATFFSCSGGKTEAAVAVWGTDIPYLQAVDSPGENAPYDEDFVQFTPEELRLLLQTYNPAVDLSGSAENWFGETELTPGEGVAAMVIGGVRFTGKELRTLLGLRSTAFTVVQENELIRFRTRGYGHRVGMSQYGARAMALAGSSYEEILLYYYQGVELEIQQP